MTQTGFCFDDLYLDVIALPNGQVEIIDGDELETALAAHVITRAQYELAWREAEAVAAAVQNGSFAPILRARDLLGLF